MKTVELASGILPIAANTKNLCLSWRSPQTRQGNMWGIVGGMVKDGLSVTAGALLEMGEEVGYYGPIELHTAFVQRRPGFEYHSFVGIVPEEFGFNPEPEFAFETSFIEWMSFAELLRRIETQSRDFHPGLLQLIRESEPLIRRFV